MKSLDISCCKNLTESDINSFLCKQSYLTSFSFREGALSDLSLEMLCDNFKQLRSVNLAGVKSITGSGLINLAKHLCHLDFIDLSWASCSSTNYVITCMHLSTKLNVIISNYFCYSPWNVQLPFLNDGRTLNGIWWTLMNGERSPNEERKESAQWTKTHCERYVNALWTQDKRFMRSTTGVILALYFFSNQKK